MREKLRLIGLTGYPKTTGGNGMHVYVPVDPIYEFAQTRSFAEILARWVAAERPDLFTTPRMTSAREKGKVYFDYLQNASRKTISAPYVLRAHPGAPVATPLKWEEVIPGLKPAQFHIANVLRRFERVGDLFDGVLTKPQELGTGIGKTEHGNGVSKKTLPRMNTDKRGSEIYVIAVLNTIIAGRQHLEVDSRVVALHDPVPRQRDDW